MGELTARATYFYPKYQDENERLYSYRKEAMRSTQYTSSI